MWVVLLLPLFLSSVHSATTTEPTTAAPTTAAPTAAPTAPTTPAPTKEPTTGAPTSSPTISWEDIDVAEIERNLTCNLANTQYRMYDRMGSPLCIVISDTNYTMFYPIVDEFTMLELENSFNQTWLDRHDNLPVYIRVEVGKKSSPWRLRSQGTGESKYVVPFYTLIVEATDGWVSNMYWDDSCFNCESPTMCVSKSCGVLFNGCQRDSNCNLQLYVGWFGTDADQSYLRSAGKRLSRFRGASLRGAFNTAVTATLGLANNARPIGT